MGASPLQRRVHALQQRRRYAEFTAFGGVKVTDEEFDS